MKFIPITGERTRLIALAFAAWIGVSASVAGTLSLTWSTDKEPVSYLPGETIIFKVQLVEDSKPLGGKTLKWRRTGDDQKIATGEGVSSATQPLEITTSLVQPGFVHLEFTVFNQDGSSIKDEKNKLVKFEGGAGVEPTRLESYPEPADFDAFWKAQKARLAEVPMEASLTKVASVDPEFEVFDVKVDCAGGKPVSGYLSMPRNAAEKSLAAQVSFMGYGVATAEQECLPGTLAFEINAHGIENGREPAYYQALKTGALRNYAFSNVENSKPETCYFNGMMLRVMRALEFVRSRPEWDGKKLIVSGGSQGGLQSIAAAALDSSVTQCEANKPWCSDLGGIKLGRLGGWRPDFANGLGYYDAANMAKRLKCEAFITAGLGDYTCPPSGVSALYNNIRAPKTIVYLQGVGHVFTNVPELGRQTVTSK